MYGWGQLSLLVTIIVLNSDKPTNKTITSEVDGLFMVAALVNLLVVDFNNNWKFSPPLRNINGSRLCKNVYRRAAPLVFHCYRGSPRLISRLKSVTLAQPTSFSELDWEFWKTSTSWKASCWYFPSSRLLLNLVDFLCCWNIRLDASFSKNHC